MGKPDGQRHEVFGFSAREAEHHPLIAGTFFLGGLLAALVAGVVHAAGDVGALRVDGVQHAATVMAETDILMVITDRLDRVADDLINVHINIGLHFAGNHHLASGAERFTRNARPADVVFLFYFLGEDGVENAVGNGIRDFVGMTHRYRFAGEQVFACGCHVECSFDFLNQTRFNRRACGRGNIQRSESGSKRASIRKSG